MRGVELERLAAFDLGGVEAIQRPVAALDRVLLVGHRLAHVDPVGDAGAVGDDERRTRPGIGLEQRLRRLEVVRAHRDLGDVDVAVRARDRAEVLLGGALAGGRELRHGAARRRLRGLAAGVRVDLGVEDEDVDVATGREDLVDAAEADVVGPAVTADDPDALADEIAGEREQMSGVGARCGPSTRASASRRRPTRSRWSTMSASVSWTAPRSPSTRSGAELRGEALEEPAGVIGLGVEREPHPEPELGVVLEQRVAPGRAAAGGVDRPRRRRQVGAVDRRAARRVGHDHAVAEELADQPDVGRLAAAAARARELEERLEDLAALDRIVRDQAAVERWDRLEEVPARLARRRGGRRPAPC